MAEWKSKIPEFWTGMLDYLEIRQHDVTKQRAKNISRRWMDFTFGVGGMNFYLGLNPDSIKVGLNIDSTETRRAQNTYQEIQRHQSQIERDFGSDLNPLIWEPRTEKRYSIRCERHVDFEHSTRAEWKEYHDWMERHLGRFQTVFVPLIRRL